MEFYFWVYLYVVKLYMLQELEDFSVFVVVNVGGMNNIGEVQRKYLYVRIEELVEDWESCLKIIQVCCFLFFVFRCFFDVVLEVENVEE